MLDSHIDKKILYQYRNVQPERKNVGVTRRGYKIFFEETRGSLCKRNYKKSDKVTSYNLVYSDGKETKMVTKEFLEANNIQFYGNYNKDMLINYLDTKSKRTDALTFEYKNRKLYNVYVTEEEKEMIKALLKKMRNEK